MDLGQQEKFTYGLHIKACKFILFHYTLPTVEGTKTLGLHKERMEQSSIIYLRLLSMDTSTPKDTIARRFYTISFLYSSYLLRTVLRLLFSATTILLFVSRSIRHS